MLIQQVATSILLTTLASNVNAITFGKRQEAAIGDYVLDVASITSVRPRREIHEMHDNDPVQFAILVKGFNAFMAIDHTQALSYHNIAALHGMPWGVNKQTMKGSETRCVKNPKTCPYGYAAHHSPAFLPWHRAYLALIEQELRKSAIKAASGLSKEYQTAADTLRFPYWDWARDPPSGESVFPSFFTTPRINIQGPSGTENVVNPFYQYTFPKDSQLVFPTAQGGGLYYNTTVRWPGQINSTGDGEDWTTVSVNSAVVNDFSSQLSFYRKHVYLVFAQLTPENTMVQWITGDPLGNDSKPIDRGASYMSIEDIHNNVHIGVGGPWNVGESNGTMTIVPWSSFDPMFWFHHAQVDRLYNLYQGIYPGSELYESPAAGNSWYYPQYTPIGMDFELRPFVTSKNSQPLSIANTWNTRGLGYYYEDWFGAKTPTDLQQRVINLYYRPADFPSPVPADASTPAKRSLSGWNHEAAEEYAALIEIDTSKFRGVARTFVFDGSDHNTTDPTQWRHADNLLGRNAFQCHHGKVQRLQIPLDVSKLRVPRNHAMHIHPHLAAMLEVRFWAETLDGEAKAFKPEDLDGCHVKIVSIERLAGNRLGRKTLVKHLGEGSEDSQALIGQFLGAKV